MRTLHKEEIERMDGDLRVAVALRMGFKWARIVAGWTEGKPIRALLPPEDDRWGAQWITEWDGDEQVTVAADAYREVPLYEFDVAKAMLVQERLHELGFWMRLQSPFEKDEKEWHAGFTPHSFTGWNGRPECRGSGISAPLAICRAALEAWKYSDAEASTKESPVEQ